MSHTDEVSSPLVAALRPPPKLVSVIIPCRNVAHCLGDQMSALKLQDYQGNFEIVVVDNGSDDETANVARSWQSELRVVVVDFPEKQGHGAALNSGCKHAHGDLIAICDGDDVASPGWLSALVRGARHADLVGGAQEVGLLNHSVVQSWRRPPPQDQLPIGCSFLPYAFSSNCGVWSDVIKAVGNFNENYPFAGGDLDFSWRVQLKSYRIQFVPDAILHYRYRETPRELARQLYQYGRADAQLFRDFRAVGMPRKLIRHLAIWVYVALYPLVGVWSARGRGRLVGYAAFQVGRLAGCWRFRTFYP